MAAGDWKNVVFGSDIHGGISGVSGGNVIALVMNTANNAWCGRFMAASSKDIKSVAVSFSAVTTPGTMTARIETIDATTGKPTGTLYDAAATKSFTPAAGINVVTFDTLPTTGLTPGVEYGFVLIKDDTGTTCTLRARVSSTALPGTVLTATDGSTRSNFGEVGANTAIGCFIDEDDAYQTLNLCPAYTNGSFLTYGADRIAAVKIVLPTSMSIKAVTGVASGIVVRAGTPAGDLRIRVLDTSNNVVSGMSWTLDKDSMANSSARGIYLPTNGLITVPAGTYRIALDSPDSANSSNCFGLRYAFLFDASLQPNGWGYSESTNQSTSFTWTDTTTNTTTLGFALDDVPASGGGGGLLRHPGMAGGMNG